MAPKMFIIINQLTLVAAELQRTFHRSVPGSQLPFVWASGGSSAGSIPQLECQSHTKSKEFSTLLYHYLRIVYCCN